MSIVLYWHPMSSASPIASALAELEVAHERVLIDLKAGEQRRPEFLALNPNGAVPTLTVDGAPMFEALAIHLWLGERYGVERGLWPAADTPERLQAMSWCAWSYVTYGAAVWSLSTALHPATGNNATSSRPSARWRSWTGCWPCWMAIWPSRPGSWAPRIRWRIWWLARCSATPPFWALRLPRIGMSRPGWTRCRRGQRCGWNRVERHRRGASLDAGPVRFRGSAAASRAVAVSSAQRHRHRPQRRRVAAADLQRAADEGELVDLVARQLIQRGQLNDGTPCCASR